VTEPSLERFLAEQRFFAGLNPDSLAFLSGCVRRRAFDTDQVLIHHGDAAGTFYLVCRGRIAREVPAIQGPSLVMHSIGGGEILGWSWLIPPRQWSFQARAEEPTEVLEFDGTAVLDRCESDPRFGYELLKRFSAVMSERLNLTRQRMIAEWNPSGFG
jgi:CRP/FNR family transcriptional regulator, cyclic AMP receptor protein